MSVSTDRLRRGLQDGGHLVDRQQKKVAQDERTASLIVDALERLAEEPRDFNRSEELPSTPGRRPSLAMRRPARSKPGRNGSSEPEDLRPSRRRRSSAVFIAIPYNHVENFAPDGKDPSSRQAERKACWSACSASPEVAHMFLAIA